jgi:hypothetical protein
MSAITLEQIATETQRLADIEAIKQLKARYVRLVDAREFEAWGKEVLAEDCHLHTDGPPLDGRDNIVSSISAALAEAKTIHQVHTPEITITGPNTATAIWPMNDFVTGKLGGTQMTLRGIGHYHEEYVRTAEGWRLKRNRLIRQRVDRE